MLEVDADFAGGRIDVLGRGSSGEVELGIACDSASDFRQWFAFRIRGREEVDVVIVNAADATIPAAWNGYRAMARGRRGTWSRLDTDFDGEVLRFRHRSGAQKRYAYFATYTARRLRSLLERVARAPGVGVDEIGQSAEGRPLYRVTAGAGPLAIWIVARQHPGETPAAFAMEGLLRSLAERRDPAIEELLRSATVHIVPSMNPDGAELGNMRTSATGADLNRSWSDPTEEDAPEIVRVLEHIDATGADLFLDVHADECSAHAFAACSEGNPNYDDTIAEQEAALRAALADLTPEFIDAPFYDLDEPGEADLTCASAQIGARYGCPSITLELPMKDTGDERVQPGWSPERAVDFGARLVDVLLRVAPELGAR